MATHKISNYLKIQTLLSTKQQAETNSTEMLHTEAKQSSKNRISSTPARSFLVRFQGLSFITGSTPLENLWLTTSKIQELIHPWTEVRTHKRKRRVFLSLLKSILQIQNKTLSPDKFKEYLTSKKCLKAFRTSIRSSSVRFPSSQLINHPSKHILEKPIYQILTQEESRIFSISLKPTKVLSKESQLKGTKEYHQMTSNLSKKHFTIIFRPNQMKQERRLELQLFYQHKVENKLLS